MGFGVGECEQPPRLLSLVGEVGDGSGPGTPTPARKRRNAGALVATDRLFAGFANPTVITVVEILVIVRILSHTQGVHVAVAQA
jgi:hypothetical protein